MREILFKAKRVDNGEWVEGYLFKSFTGIPYILTLFDHILNLSEAYEVDESTVSQYTGLTDKNGKKIWENSIVRKSDTNALGWHRERKCKVSLHKMGYWLITTEYGDGYWLGEFDSEQLEVIGNIFDNAELLEG